VQNSFASTTINVLFFVVDYITSAPQGIITRGQDKDAGGKNLPIRTTAVRKSETRDICRYHKDYYFLTKTGCCVYVDQCVIKL